MSMLQPRTILSDGHDVADLPDWDILSAVFFGADTVPRRFRMPLRIVVAEANLCFQLYATVRLQAGLPGFGAVQWPTASGTGLRNN